MIESIFGIFGSVLLIIIGLFKYFQGKNEFKKKESEKAKQDLDNAKENDSASDFLDGFSNIYFAYLPLSL